MPTLLDEIVAYKQAFVAAAKERVSRDDMIVRATSSPLPPPFADRLLATDGTAVIAEIKKASPSKGLIREDFDPEAIARTYVENGAACISVLTDEKYFQGSDGHLQAVKGCVEAPLLRKDFTVEPYQVMEARVLGASAVLLIVSILAPLDLEAMITLARELSLDPLVEVHSEDEARIALDAGALLIGINNRDLRTFTTDLGTTERVGKVIPDDVMVVSESGIRSREDVERVLDAGADAILVGESLMRERDIGAKLRELQGRP